LEKLHRQSREALINKIDKCHFHDAIWLSRALWQIEKVVETNEWQTQHSHQT